MSETALNEIKLSDRNTVILRPLSAYEMMVADGYGSPQSNGTQTDKIYAVCAIRSLNGKEVNPFQNKTEFAVLAQRISSGELFKLMIEFNKLTVDDFSEDLKKELAALVPDSSPQLSSIPKVD